MTGLPMIKNLSLSELEQEMAAMGQPGFRAQQIAHWVHKKGVHSFRAMTNLPAGLQEKLAARFNPGGLILLEKSISRDGSTTKYLLGLDDGEAVETVLMRYRHGLSACLSTQVGCRMGCQICASGLGGLVRNLEPGEIIDQIWAMQQDTGCRVGSIVLMGSGEPLDNYDVTVKFLELVQAPYGLHLGQRHLTLSTCGIVPRIYDLARLRLAITLAISLHAPNNKLRNKLMPINKVYPLEELLPACAAYARTTGRRVTFEYAMLRHTNDGREQARELAEILKGIHCHVNLIPVNPVPEHDVERSDPRQVQIFRVILEKAGYPVTVRREMGTGIDAACGQLRRRVLKTKGNLPGGNEV